MALASCTTLSSDPASCYFKILDTDIIFSYQWSSFHWCLLHLLVKEHKWMSILVQNLDNQKKKAIVTARKIPVGFYLLFNFLSMQRNIAHWPIQILAIWISWVCNRRKKGKGNKHNIKTQLLIFSDCVCVCRCECSCACVRSCVRFSIIIIIIIICWVNFRLWLRVHCIVTTNYKTTNWPTTQDTQTSANRQHHWRSARHSNFNYANHVCLSLFRLPLLYGLCFILFLCLNFILDPCAQWINFCCSQSICCLPLSLIKT